MNAIFIIIRAIFFYLLPLSIGRALNIVLPKAIKKEKEANMPVGKYFAIGTLFMLLVAAAVHYVPFNITFSPVYFVLIWVLGAVSLGVNAIFRPKLKSAAKKGLTTTLLVLLLSTLVYGIWFHKSPTSLNWDVYQHQSLSRYLLDGKFSLLTTQITDTFGFNSYPPTFHLLVAASQFGASLTPEFIATYWQVLGFLHLLTVGFASYLVGKTFSKSHEVGLVSTLVGIVVFDSVISFTNLFILPQTVAATLFAYLLSHIVESSRLKEKFSFDWLFMVSFVALPMLHYVIGTLALIVLVSVYVYTKANGLTTKTLRHMPIIQLVLMLIVGGVLASQFIDLSQLNRGEASLYMFSFDEKIKFIQRSYGYLLFFFVPVGIYWALKKKGWEDMLSLLLLFGFIGIIMSGFPYVWKFYVLARFIIHYFIAAGIVALVAPVSNKVLKIVAYTGVAVVLFALLIANTVYWKNNLSYQDQYTHVSSYDIQAAEYLSENKCKGVNFIVSDPATQLILEGFSPVDSPGGGFMTDDNRMLITEVINSQSSDERIAAYINIEDGLYDNHCVDYLVLSGRSFLWAAADAEYRYRFDYNIWSPRELTPENKSILRQIDSEAAFEQVYESAYLAVFKVNK